MNVDFLIPHWGTRVYTLIKLELELSALARVFWEARFFRFVDAITCGRPWLHKQKRAWRVRARRVAVYSGP
eukprot:scaffold142991_cov130-Phaeocystis_antarctica.AAC.2